MTDGHLEELRKANQRRLRILELQAATYGISVPPHIVTEIEDIEDALNAIDMQLLQEQGSLSQECDKKKTVVLFLSADPTNAARIRLGEELRAIQHYLQLAKLRDRFVLESRVSVRPEDISQALLDVQPEFVHFSGHGTDYGALCFEDHKGEVHLVQPDALAALFAQFTNQVRCVLLNACYSEVQANAIVQHVDFVIGMNQAIGDKAAIAFAVGFYQALGAGRDIESSYKFGCIQIGLQGIPEHSTPVLVEKM